MTWYRTLKTLLYIPLVAALALVVLYTYKRRETDTTPAFIISERAPDPILIAQLDDSRTASTNNTEGERLELVTEPGPTLRSSEVFTTGSPTIDRLTNDSPGIAREEVALTIDNPKEERNPAKAEGNSATVITTESTVRTTGNSATVRTTANSATVRTTGNPATVRTTGNLATVRTTGNSATVRTTGHPATVRTTGHSATVRTTGHPATVRTTGHPATVRTTGHPATVRTTGNPATVRTTGNSATVRTTGNSATVRTTGNSATVRTTGHPATVRTTGNSATVRTTGNSATVRTTANPATVRTTGNPATVKTTGNPATVRTTGNSATVRTTGNSATVRTTGHPATVRTTGKSRTHVGKEEGKGRGEKTEIKSPVAAVRTEEVITNVPVSTTNNLVSRPSTQQNQSSVHANVTSRNVFTISKPFAFPHPTAFRHTADILASVWVKQLKDHLGSITHPKRVTLTVASADFTGKLLNWLISALVIAKPPLENIIVVSFDENLHKLLKSRGIMSLFVPYRSVLLKPNGIGIGQVWMTRMAVIRLINHWGYDVQQFDNDAIILKNPQPLFDQFPDSDVVGSRAMLPFELGKGPWGFTVCMGAILFRSTPRTGKFALCL